MREGRLGTRAGSVCVCACVRACACGSSVEKVGGRRASSSVLCRLSAIDSSSSSSCANVPSGSSMSSCANAMQSAHPLARCRTGMVGHTRRDLIVPSAHCTAGRPRPPQRSTDGRTPQQQHYAMGFTHRRPHRMRAGFDGASGSRCGYTIACVRARRACVDVCVPARRARACVLVRARE